MPAPSRMPSSVGLDPRPASEAPALSLDHISMTFPDGTAAIDDVSFSVRRGEFVTVVGPSGCGKSTLLRIASGLLGATGGTVEIDRNHLGYVFQDATLLPWRTVRQNVELLAQLRKVSPANRRRMAQDAIQMVGLGGFEDHYPKTLSGGMKMRASLARSLVLRPPLFFFDEPFAAVDEMTREHLNDQTLAMFTAENFGALFITHSISEAVYMSTRVLVMSPRPGRITAEFDVPFPYPRHSDLRFDPEFVRLSAEVSQALRATVES